MTCTAFKGSESSVETASIISHHLSDSLSDFRCICARDNRLTGPVLKKVLSPKIPIGSRLALAFKQSAKCPKNPWCREGRSPPLRHPLSSQFLDNAGSASFPA